MEKLLAVKTLNKALTLVMLASTVVLLLVVLALATFSPGESGAGKTWQPEPGTSWQWQLSEPIESPINVDAYDVDGFESGERIVKTLHDNDSKAICYINVGAWENWRPDKDRFPEEVLGKNYSGWAGERWLDIREVDALAPIMRDRMDMCKRKGFDAIEPDNMDNYTNDTGFPIKARDQLRYNEWLATEAHRRDLAIALKNDPDQAETLEPLFDFAITEDCFDEGWCGKMRPFTESGKAVLAAEYTDTGIRREEFCPEAERLGFDAILKKRDLGAWRRGC